MRRVLLAALPAVLIAVGCGAEQTAERKEPFQPSQPPPGYIEERIKAREAAPSPGRPSARTGRP